jgi:prepilin-type N-terminal cleavage/methylation domain-containing protein
MGKRAFTLIEITIALLILAIGLVGILTLFPVGFDASGRAAHTTEATLLAQALIEDAKRVGYPRVLAENGRDALYPNHGYYEYEVTTFDGLGNPPTLVGEAGEVVICVYWPADAGSPGNRANQRFVELSTYLARYE